MPKLEKLLIQGIRSFNPKDENVIEFQSPLTLIVGANGTGKTTIIECLRFATTGDMPPNSRGGAFVFDPKLAKQIDVKAEVKLKFQSEKGELLVCVRTIQASVRKSKAEQKTLECTLLKEIDETEFLITSKIADIDKLIPEYLGISHSILDNVIFCHQDESVWPVGDPTAMKKKLDDIFSSTKYNKALLGLKASKKEITSDLKLKTQQLSFYLKEKMKRDEILKKITSQSEEVDRKNFKIKTFGDELDQLNMRLEEMVTNLRIFEKLENNHRLLRVEYENCSNFIKTFNYPKIDDLNIEKYSQKISSLEKQICELNECPIEDDFEKVELLRSKILAQEIENSRCVKMTEEIQKQIENLENEKSKLISDLCKEFSCSENEIKVKVKENLNLMEAELTSKTEDLNKEKEKLMAQRNIQKNSSNFIKESKLFIEKYKNLKSVEDLNLNEIPIDYEMQDEISHSIEDLLEKLTQKRNKLSTVLGNSDSHFKRKHLSESIQKLSNNLTKSSEDYKIQIEAESKYLNQLFDLLKSFRQKHQRNLALNEQRDNTNRKAIDEIIQLSFDIRQDEIGDSIIKLFNLSKSESFETSMENSFNKTVLPNGHQQKSIRIKDPENFKLSNNPRTYLSSNRISSVKNLFTTEILTLESLEDTSDLKNELNDINDKIATFSSANKVYSNFLKVGSEKNQCPLCIRSFEESSKHDFEKKLRNVLDKIPSSLDDLNNKKSEAEMRLKNKEFENQTIQNRNACKQKLNEALKQLSAYENLHEEEISQLEFQTEIREKDLNQLREEYKEAINIESSIKNMQAELSQIAEQSNATEIEEEIKELKKTIEIRHKEQQSLTKKIKESELRNKLIQHEIENRKLIERRDSLINELKNMKVIDLKELEDQVTILESEREEANRKLIKMKMILQMKFKRIEEIRTLVTKNRVEHANLSSHIIDLYKDKTISFNGEILTSEALKENEKYEKLRQMVISHKNSIIRTAKELENAKYELKTVEENVKLKKHQDKMKIIEDEFNRFDMKAYKQLKLDIDTLESKKAKLSSTESLLRGELKQIVQTIKTLNSELEEYKDTNKNYLKCSIEIKVLELSSEDLDKCINGLDKAIVDFHSSKIEDVNRTLKDLWINTYKGNDIDYIELKSESSETRAYNYRLVMVKNGIELDMRGRSSAGQKMIASLLFRIALADSFSTGCNIFALDEPTTNLDRENIESLAFTLSSIIKNRHNTQFIVITHDEEFVQLLNREGTEYFYRILRDSKGNSHIQRHSIYK